MNTSNMIPEEPQSLVHQVLRLEQRFSGALKKRGSKTKQRRKKKGSTTLSQSFSECDMTISTWHTISQRGPEKRGDISLDGESSIDMCSLDSGDTLHTGSVDAEPLASLQNCSSTEGVVVPDDVVWTVDQYTFLEEIEGSNGTVFIHFFVQGSKLSDSIDLQMIELAAQSTSRFLRLDAESSSHVTVKHDVNNSRASVVAMRDGKVVNKLTQFMDPNTCNELPQWISTIELMGMFASMKR